MGTETAASAATPDAAAAAAAEAYPRSALYQAIREVQKAAPALPRDATNPDFGSRFTSLTAIVEHIGPILVEHGLVWITLPGSEAGEPALRYELTHAASAEQITGTMPLLLGKKDSQGFGSALTYARRYALCAVLNLVGDDDDDGNSASVRPGTQTAPVAPALDDDEAKALVAECKALYDRIKELDPKAIVPGTYGGWVASAQSSHSELKRLRAYLQERLEGMQS